MQVMEYLGYSGIFSPKYFRHYYNIDFLFVYQGGSFCQGLPFAVYIVCVLIMNTTRNIDVKWMSFMWNNLKNIALVTNMIQSVMLSLQQYMWQCNEYSIIIASGVWKEKNSLQMLGMIFIWI